ncbi:DUF5421 family protein [Chlamydia psittaci]|uniref:Outer protein E n=1 Tax=Chlamydia psittaci TaxID=83554 RepID=A9NIP4_CHLPS|nr:DUF5421 family protein [Chlamydia psittaci]ABC62093.1 outer protein E [Chlamydia psittaci]AFS27576.1 outer protein E [Chlamydia psittaci NJ1]KPZ36443.1 hypothetical protein GWE_03965 [Chlamydia psittaci NJ1]MDS0919628.1 DUF5421 family protein [Chlamydia psittaci]MDS0989659.1 DUF5421 family protein [Chlamydia psittaci]
MELNKTSESLYNCKTDHHSIQQEVGPEPKDNRDVKVFSLEGRQQSKHNRQDKTTSKSSRQEARGADDKHVEEKTSGVSSKEEEKEEGQNFMAYDNPTAGMAFVDIAPSVSSEVVVESATVAVASADLQWVQDVIASTVESMIVADVNGQQLVELVLDAEGNVPEVFAGANLTLVQSGTDLSVKFSNFMDDVQLTEAVNLISNNPSQLAGLVESLKNLRLNLTELTVGTSIVQLPTIEEVQTPLHMIAATIHQRDEEKDQEGKDQQQQQDQEQNQYKVEEARL